MYSKMQAQLSEGLYYGTRGANRMAQYQFKQFQRTRNYTVQVALFSMAS